MFVNAKTILVFCKCANEHAFTRLFHFFFLCLALLSCYFVFVSTFSDSAKLIYGISIETIYDFKIYFFVFVGVFVWNELEQKISRIIIASSECDWLNEKIYWFVLSHSPVCFMLISCELIACYENRCISLVCMWFSTPRYLKRTTKKKNTQNKVSREVQRIKQWHKLTQIQIDSSKYLFLFCWNFQCALNRTLNN